MEKKAEEKKEMTKYNLQADVTWLCQGYFKKFSLPPFHLKGWIILPPNARVARSQIDLLADNYEKYIYPKPFSLSY